MSDYKLYCFAQSGNAYRGALMLNLIGAKWEPIWVDFFAGLVQRKPEYREGVNEMGEVPVLVDGDKKLTQSAVILTYLARKSGKFLPKGEDEELEALRWIVFDNQKVNGFLGPYRFLRTLAKPPGDPAVLAFLKGRIDDLHGALADYNAGLKLNDKLGEGYVDRGAVMISLHRYQVAYDDISKGIELGASKPAVAYYDRAIVNEALGNVRAAYDDLQKALQIDPNMGLASMQLQRFKVTRTGGAPSRTNASGAPRITCAAMCAWYLPWCVSSARPFVSPIA